MLVLLSLALTITSLAHADITKCSSVAGSYSCDFQGKSYPMKVAIDTEANRLTVDLDGEGGSFIVDGYRHKSEVDATTYNATCAADGSISVLAYMGERMVGSFSLNREQERLLYNLVDGRKQIELSCL
jgi:hypothetical protein